MKLTKPAATSSKRSKNGCSSGKKNSLTTVAAPGSTGRVLFDMKTHISALLSSYTTFQLGGPCQCLVECATPDELIQTVQKFKNDGTPFLLIGGGSNLVISDQGLNTTVIRYVSPVSIIQR